MILNHFPHIYERCLEEGYDVTKEWIPVVPAQHYFMGGIHVDANSKTTMNQLYAVGETSCNGVHGANRLASNSLLESLVFAERAAKDIEKNKKKCKTNDADFDKLYQEVQDCIVSQKECLAEVYKNEILKEIERERQAK